jgi:fused signal recognition particle receptor
MFKFLKEKIHDWKEKLKEEFTEEVKQVKEKTTKIKSPKKEKLSKKSKETTVKSKATKKTDKIKLIDAPTKFNPVDGTLSLDLEKVDEISKVKQEEHRGFFSKLFSKEDKTAELIIEDIKKEGREITSPEARLESESSLEETKSEETHGFFDKFKKKVTEERFEEIFQELQIIMLQNNVAYEVVEYLKQRLKHDLVGKNLSEVNLEEKLRDAISEILINPPSLVKEIKESLKTKKPYVIAFVGINGSGKTTSIAKVAHLLKKEKLSVCLAAADTFRAAAIEQLEIHADRLKIPIIKKDYNSDPASVGFEAISYAKKHGIDVVLIDTAGRMNTKESLMKEMEKIIKVCNPDKKIFLGESITGNDATEQARAFNQHISIDGMILSKADIDEKGGTALSVSYITKKPIYFLGTGQTYDDLEIFDKDKMIKRLGL